MARAQSPMVERRVAGTRTSETWMQNVVDDVSLRPTAAGSSRTDTVVLLRLDSGALERKVYTECFQEHAASAKPDDISSTFQSPIFTKFSHDTWIYVLSKV